jgi:hypothetical protein
VVGHIREFTVRDMGWCYYRWFSWPQRENSKVEMVPAATSALGSGSLRSGRIL